jgi:hypothetical protein
MQPPKHYGDTKLMDLLIEKEVPFAEANIMKYVFRWKDKDGIPDLYKARDYLHALIAHAELAEGRTTMQTHEGLLHKGAIL